MHYNWQTDCKTSTQVQQQTKRLMLCAVNISKSAT
jgi:hypothetical protein